jgi:hypothetical protein
MPVFHPFTRMSGHQDSLSCKTKDRFRLQFQHGLREYLARHSCAAEGFGLVWQRTLQEVPLHEAAQAEVYWELIQWARSYDLYTSDQKSF